MDDFLLHATKLPKTVIMEDASRILELMDDDENTDLYKVYLELAVEPPLYTLSGTRSF